MSWALTRFDKFCMGSGCISAFFLLDYAAMSPGPFSTFYCFHRRSRTKTETRDRNVWWGMRKVELDGKELSQPG